MKYVHIIKKRVVSFDPHCQVFIRNLNIHHNLITSYWKYTGVVSLSSVSTLVVDGMLHLLAHWEWFHVFGIPFFPWVAPSGLGTSALCPCPGVLHPSYVLAISRDVGKASVHGMLFSPGLLSLYMSVYTCVRMCSHGFSVSSFELFSTLLSFIFTVLLEPHRTANSLPSSAASIALYSCHLEYCSK